MVKSSIALTCCLVALALGGCGGGSKTASTAGSGSTATSAATPAERAQACTALSQADVQYHNAVASLGLKFKDKPLLATAIAAIGQLRTQAQKLQSLSSGGDASVLGALASALNQQGTVLSAISRGDFATASANDKGLNEALATGLPKLKQICPNA